jgi:SAM-dependent methyltransferase
LGIFAATAAERGWRVHAVEPSQLAASRARSLTGESVKLHVGGFLDLDLPEGSFDAITFWDVLAHLIDPKTAIAKAASLLAPGGVLVVRTPVRPRAFFFALRWFGAFHRLRASLVHFPMQSCHFQADGLARALRAGGFGEVVARREVRSVTTRATGSWILKHPRGFAYSEAERLARRVFPQESLTVRAKIAPRPIASADGIARSGERP